MPRKFTSLLAGNLPPKSASDEPAQDDLSAGQAQADASSPEASANDSPRPARPQRLTVDFYQEPDGILLRTRGGGGPQLFLMLWLTGWTVGCVVLIVHFLNEPSIGSFFFGVPFWVSWIAVFAMICWNRYGKETLLLRPDKAIFLRTVIVTLNSRAVPRSEIEGFRECRSIVQENDQYLWGIELVTLGKPVKLAFRLPDAERLWLVDQLNQYLTDTSADGAPLALATTAPTATPRRGAASNQLAGVQILTDERTLAEPPTDNRWGLTDDIASFELSTRGRFNIGSVLGMLFINAFWNGIVSVFVLALWGLMPGNHPRPAGVEWWGIFVFLIPFEVIGLVMLAALVMTLLEPLHVTRWIIDASAISREHRWLLVAFRRSWSVERLDRLELRPGNARLRSPKLSTSTDLSNQFQLALVAADNADVCTIDSLTKGEARWFGYLIRDRRSDWFKG